MRIFYLLPIFSLSFGASTPSLHSRWLNGYPLDARDVTNVCTFIDTELQVPNANNDFVSVGVLSQFNYSPSQPISSALTVKLILTDYCLCLSHIPRYLDDIAISIAQAVT
jgi:hypothetical protein